MFYFLLFAVLYVVFIRLLLSVCFGEQTAHYRAVWRACIGVGTYFGVGVGQAWPEGPRAG